MDFLLSDAVKETPLFQIYRAIVVVYLVWKQADTLSRLFGRNSNDEAQASLTPLQYIFNAWSIFSNSYLLWQAFHNEWPDSMESVILSAMPILLKLLNILSSYYVQFIENEIE